jgi:hypothetical protein
MADGKVELLMQAQLKKERNTVRDMARRLYVNYALWEPVRETMEKCQIDTIDLAEFLANSVVVEFWNLLGLSRYRVESNDSAERIASVTVSMHQDSMTIEVVALRIKEAT